MKKIIVQHTPTLNTAQSRKLGAMFRSVREAQGLSAQDAADRLLLSKQQILGLEDAELKYFYGAKLYAQAADKYASLLALDVRPSELFFNEAGMASLPTANANKSSDEADIAAQIQHVATEDSSPPTPIKINKLPEYPRHSRVFKGTVAIIIVVAILILGKTLVAQHEAASPEVTIARQEPPTPASAPEAAVAAPATNATLAANTTPATMQPTPEPEKAVSPTLAAPVAEKTDDLPPGSIRLAFSGASWVQAVDTSGHKQENTYKAGESLTLEPARLQALVIGNAKVVTVSSTLGAISLSPYVGSGSDVARVIGPQIRQLAARTSP